MKLLSVTGAWTDTPMVYLAQALGFIFGVLERNADWLAPAAFAVCVCLALFLTYRLAIKTYHGVRRAWRWFSHRVRKHPVTRRAGGYVMAKWERSLVADILHDALFHANLSGKLSDKQYDRWQRIVGKGMGLPDLLPRKIHRMALKNYFEKRAKLAGPVNKIPGAPDGKAYIPAVESNVVPNSDFLRRLKEKRAA